MGKGADTTQTSTQGSQTTSYDPWIAKAQQGLAGLAFGQYAGQPYTRAGANLDQQKAFDLARTGVNQYGYGSGGAVAGGRNISTAGRWKPHSLAGPIIRNS